MKSERVSHSAVAQGVKVKDRHPACRIIMSNMKLSRNV